MPVSFLQSCQYESSDRPPHVRPNIQDGHSTGNRQNLSMATFVTCRFRAIVVVLAKVSGIADAVDPKLFSTLNDCVPTFVVREIQTETN